MEKPSKNLGKSSATVSKKFGKNLEIIGCPTTSVVRDLLHGIIAAFLDCGKVLTTTLLRHLTVGVNPITAPRDLTFHPMLAALSRVTFRLGKSSEKAWTGSDKALRNPGESSGKGGKKLGKYWAKACQKLGKNFEKARHKLGKSSAKVRKTLAKSLDQARKSLGNSSEKVSKKFGQS